MMPSCEKCGLEISEYEKINFLGCCKNCYTQKRRKLKLVLIFIILLGLLFISFGIVGVYVIVQDLIIGYSSATTSEDLTEFGVALIFAIITFLMMIFFTLFGIYLLKGGIRRFKTLRVEVR